VALYLLVRFEFTVFGNDFSISVLPLQVIFISLGVVGIFVASTVAVYQTNIKRLFAYSSVAQIGYIVVGLGIGTAAGLQASLLHLFNHALMKGALFLALAAVMYRVGGVEFHQLRGLAKRMPWTMAAMMIGGLSLIGMPLTVGFVSKWYLILAAFTAGLWPLALLLVLASLIAIIYVWRLVEAVYFYPVNETPEKTATIKEAPLSFLIPLWVLAIANFYFGIDTRLTVGITELAAHYLFNPGAQ
jgi:multicomponent Na+:H+ antiporter subunit D